MTTKKDDFHHEGKAGHGSFVPNTMINRGPNARPFRIHFSGTAHGLHLKLEKSHPFTSKLVERPTGALVAWLLGCLVACFVGWLDGWLLAWLLGWLLGWMVGWVRLGWVGLGLGWWDGTGQQAAPLLGPTVRLK